MSPTTNDIQAVPERDRVHADLAFELFLKNHPAFEATISLEFLWEREYRRLDEQRHLYLDYTGGGLYAGSQIQERLHLLRKGVLGNPHSGNPASLTKTRLVDSARNYVLEDSGGKSAGALRVSLGVVCNFAEVYGFVEFARSLLDRRAGEIWSASPGKCRIIAYPWGRRLLLP